MTGFFNKSSIIKRWLVFNSVGAMGIIVQIAVLWVLASGFQIGYLLATGLAVEAAILHNFFWHEHWTWVDRTKNCNRGIMKRFLYFHMANGVISLIGNIVLMQFFVERLGVHYMPANLLSVAICSMLNFLAGNNLVYRHTPIPIQKGETDVSNKPRRIAAAVFAITAASFLLTTAPATAADLKSETLKAWNAAVEETERRISAELSSDKGFLAMDFLDPQEAARERRAVLSGKIPIKQISTIKNIKVPDGMIHHWRGSVFIPGVPLDFVLSRVKDPDLEDTKQEDVLDSKVLERSPSGLKLYLKLQQSNIITVVYNTEHLIRYKNHGSGQESSRSVATKIAEIEFSSNSDEREKPEGHDRGFLWRMNSYWRYQRVDGGVIVECESMTLSRSVPFLLEYFVGPLIKSTARESMNRTLESMRMRMIRAYHPSPSQTFNISRQKMPNRMLLQPEKQLLAQLSRVGFGMH
jgi:putative flippase GtrA